jgi:D-sedoheptulose 7-phosphate isomerase
MSAMIPTPRTVAALLRDSAQVHRRLSVARRTQDVIVRAAEAMVEALHTGHKIIWFGNGGSATQSQHMAAEFVGRFCKERRSLPALSLTENMASVTAIANDYHYHLIFVRQLEGLGQPGDVAIGLSTSGKSANVIAALKRAKSLGLTTVGLTRAGAPQMQAVCDWCIGVPSTVTARIQEAHLTIGHILCALVEDALI